MCFFAKNYKIVSSNLKPRVHLGCQASKNEINKSKPWSPIKITNCNSPDLGGSLRLRLSGEALLKRLKVTSPIRSFQKLMVDRWNISKEKKPQKKRGDRGT
jgi:hypothetical protein